MLGKLGWRHMLLAAALMLFLSGCYTVVSRSTSPVRVTSRVEAVETPAPAGDENASDDRGGNASDDQYSDTAESDDAEANSDYDSRENTDFGIRAGKYDRTDTGIYTESQDADGKTIINNYYDTLGPEYNTDWRRYGYSRSWYDPWDWYGTPYYWRPHFRVGIMYDPWDPFYWHDPWSWGFGVGWYGSYAGYDPWYYGGGYSWDPWYRYSWYNHHYDPWYYGGGGGGGGHGYGGNDDNYDGPRRVRSDRLAGFGTGRGGDGVVNVGGTTEKSAPDYGSGPSTRGRVNDGFGTTGSRRRSATDVSEGATEKPASANVGTSRRGASTSRDNSGRQRVRSTETGRRYQVMGDPDNIVDTMSRPVRREGDDRYRWRGSEPATVQRETSTGVSDQKSNNSGENTQQRTRANTWRRGDATVTRPRETGDSGSENARSTPRETTTPSRNVSRTPAAESERNGDSQSTQRGTTEQSRPTYSPPQRSTGSSSQPSYSPPSRGGSGSSGGGSRSGGGGSRSGGGGSGSTGSTGSRRR